MQSAPSLAAALELTFPDGHNRPADATKLVHVVLIARHVTPNLCGPILSVALGHPRAALASMTVPEATVHEDEFAPSDKRKVGLAEYVCPMQPVPEAKICHEASYDQLRTCTGATYRPHRAATSISRVGHDLRMAVCPDCR